MFSPSNGQMLGLFQLIFKGISKAFSWFFEQTIGKAVKPILMFFVNYIMTAYYYICKTLYSAFLLPIGRVMDICQMIFRKFAGIDTMKIKNLQRSQMFGNAFQSDDIVMNLISSDIVQRIFFAMLILAVILLIVSTFIANIKTEFNAQDKGGNNKRKVFKNALRGLVNFIAVPVISLFAIILSNGLLRAIDGATQVNGSQTWLSGQLFVASAYNANRARKSQDNEKGNGYYVSKSFGALITCTDYSSTLQDGGGYANFGVFLDDEQSGGFRAADKIDNAFASGLSLKVQENAKRNRMYYGDKLDFWYGGMDVLASFGSMIITGGGTAPGGYTTFPEGYKGSYGAFGDIQFHWEALLGIIGIDVTDDGLITYEVNWSSNKGIDADYGHISFSIYDTALVFYYYDISLTTFSFLTFIIAGFYFCYVLIATAIGLIKRLFMVTALFIISPPICALYPIDEGKTLERWRGAFVKELLSAYAVIITMNIFLSLLPLFVSIEVFSTDSMSSRFLQLFPLYTWWIDPFIFESGTSNSTNVALEHLTPSALTPIVGFLNVFARLLIIVGGLHFFKKAVAKIAEIIGAGDAFSEGAEVAAKIAKTIGGAAALAVGGGAMIAAKSSAKKAAAVKKKNAGGSGGAGGGEGAPTPEGGGTGDAPGVASQDVQPKAENAMGGGEQGQQEQGQRSGQGKGQQSSGSGGGSDPYTKGIYEMMAAKQQKEQEEAAQKNTFIGKLQRGASAFNKIKDVVTGKSGFADVLDDNKGFGKTFKKASRTTQKNNAIINADRQKKHAADSAQAKRNKQAAYDNKMATNDNFRAKEEAKQEHKLDKTIEAQEDEMAVLNKQIAKLEKKVKPSDDTKLTTTRKVRKNRENTEKLENLRKEKETLEEQLAKNREKQNK